MTLWFFGASWSKNHLQKIVTDHGFVSKQSDTDFVIDEEQYMCDYEDQDRPAEVEAEPGRLRQ